MFLVVIDYASIVLFFVLLASLLFLVMRQRPEKAGEVRARAQEMVRPSTRVQTISYGLLAGLFVLLLMVAILADRGSSPSQSRT